MFYKANHLGPRFYAVSTLAVVLLTSCTSSQLTSANHFITNGKGQDNQPILKREKALSSKALRSMARVYTAYGQYAKAQPLIEQALLAARKSNASDYELAMCLIDRASLYKKQSRLSDAEKNCLQGLILQKSALSDDHPYIAYTLRILSSIYQEQGNLRQAKSALEKARVIMLDCHNKDDYPMVPLNVDTAKLLVAQGNLSQAEPHYSHALSIINKHRPDHLYKATVLENLAELYLLQGKYVQAEPLINEAISMKENSYGPEHQLLVPALFTKARIERVKGNYATSEKSIQRALIAVAKTENITRIVSSQQLAKEIRSGKIATDKLVAKAAK